MPNVLQILRMTKQRLAILPGLPSSDAPRTLSEIQEILGRKSM